MTVEEVRAKVVALPAALPAFDPLDRATLQSQAYDQLRRAMMEGVFRPGAAITIRAAAEALSVSPMPVRAALLRLEAEGALVAQGGKRTLAVPTLTAEEYRELRDIRIINEGLAAERAAGAITDEELSEVERCCEAMQAAADAGDPGAYSRANWALHLSVYRASRMRTLISLIEGLWLRVGPYVPTMMPDKTSLERSMPDHWRILEACRRRDGVAARAAIADDITRSAVRLIVSLQGS
ncbi:MAG: GntR family transcriptional regulator [Caulobacteraceae bacterium]